MASKHTITISREAIEELVDLQIKLGFVEPCDREDEIQKHESKKLSALFG